MPDTPLSKHNIDQLHDRLVNLGIEWADKDAAASLLEETRKTVLAEIGRESNEASAAAKEQYAYASPRYAEHVKAMVEARRLALRAKVKYEAAQVWFEAARTVESTRRVEMSLK